MSLKHLVQCSLRTSTLQVPVHSGCRMKAQVVVCLKGSLRKLNEMVFVKCSEQCPELSKGYITAW